MGFTTKIRCLNNFLVSIQRLRTCSLPDLRLLFQTVEEDKGVTEERDESLVDCENVKPSTDEDKEEVNCEDDDEDDDLEQEVDIGIACDERRV